MINLANKPWWSFLTPDQKDNLSQSYLLLQEENQQPNERFSDYSFIVFPAAKAYEGFLKKLFLALKLIEPADYYGEHFRIGKSLNPSLKHEYPNNHVYAKLETVCQGPSLPQTLWHAWKQSRNLLFHWFPQQKNAISRLEAKQRIELIVSAIDAAFSQCHPPLLTRLI